MHTDQRSSNRKNSEKHKKELTNKQNQQNKQTNKAVEDDIPTGFFKTGNKQLHRSVTNIKIIIAHDRILVSSCHSHRQVSSLELIFNLLYQLACNIFRLSFTFEERECPSPHICTASNLKKASALHAKNIITSLSHLCHNPKSTESTHKMLRSRPRAQYSPHLNTTGPPGTS